MSCVNKMIAKLSLKQPRYNFSDLQDSKTQEESTSSDTYRVSSRIRNVSSQEHSLQAPNHRLFVFFASGALFSVHPEHSPWFFASHGAHVRLCALWGCWHSQGWDCDALKVVSSRCHLSWLQMLNIQHSIQGTFRCLPKGKVGHLMQKTISH